jgi:2-polyprenyl-3-methyl-5-hydroxy-6-metoxy-1,4-benzoquinol methylase
VAGGVADRARNEAVIETRSSNYNEARQEHRAAYHACYDAAAAARPDRLSRNSYYYDELKRFIQFATVPGKRVLCIGADVGQYLEWCAPSVGVGIEDSLRLVELARQRYPQFDFRCGALEDLDEAERYDYILLINTVNGLFDVQTVFERCYKLCHSDTRLVIATYNFLWQPLAMLAEHWGIKRPQPAQNWLSPASLDALLHLSNLEPVRTYRFTLCPYRIPLVSSLLNNWLATLPLIERLGLNHGIVARAVAAPASHESRSVSVVIPCRNERDNVEAAVLRTPRMGSGTELIFCDDKSTDGTADEVRRMQALYPQRNIKLVEGPGVCKAENVWTGFAHASGDILMILDGDLAVPPEELPRFYDAIATRKGDFINGTRMVYPMRDQAMRLANVFGNKMFSWLFTYLLRQNITDTLCGTKVLSRAHYEQIRGFVGSWGVSDCWGDYELIFGAARLHLKQVEVPVHYMERTYGATKMVGRLRTAATMFRMCFAAWRSFRRFRVPQTL